MEFSHIPVLLQPCLDGLNIDLPVSIWMHRRRRRSQQRNRQTPDHRTSDLARSDPDAVAVATERLKGLPAQVVQVNFREAARVLAELGIPAVNGACSISRVQPPAG